jgi:predicted RNA-binding Zn ribbon-like protein
MEITELPLVGGHPALDLVNTVERGTPAPGSQPLDYLTDPPALLRWAHRVNLVDEAEARAVTDSWEQDPSSAHAALAAVRDTREALHLALLATIAAVGRSRLVLEPERATPAQLAVGLTPGLLVPDRAADAAVDVLRMAGLARLRRCPPDAGGCGWVFLDRSRNGSRRWCRMADCGTTAKARRLTERRRAARTPSAK